MSSPVFEAMFYGGLAETKREIKETMAAAFHYHYILLGICGKGKTCVQYDGACSYLFIFLI